jgi:hypothetical protein
LTQPGTDSENDIFSDAYSTPKFQPINEDLKSHVTLAANLIG